MRKTSKLFCRIFWGWTAGTALVSASGWCGTIHGGGGLAILCGDPGQERVYLADTFELARQGQLNEVKTRDPDEIFETAIDLIEKNSPEKVLDHPYLPHQKVTLGWMLSYKNSRLAFVDSPSRLPLLNDDHFGPLPEECRKEQLAVQDISIGQVKIDRELRKKMTPAEEGFFRLHETLIALRAAPAESTEPIRKKISDLLSDPRLSFESLMKEVQKTGNTRTSYALAPAETLLGQSCHSSGASSGPWISIPSTSDLMNSLFCGISDRARMNRDSAQRQESALQSLLKVPARLDCRVGGPYRNDLNLQPQSFVVTREKGDGSSQASPRENRYRIQTAGKTEGSLSEFSHFDVDQNHRPSPNAKIGKLRFDMTWPESRQALIIDSYNERTKEFVGVLIVDSAENSERHSEFVVGCAAPDAEFGIR